MESEDARVELELDRSRARGAVSFLLEFLRISRHSENPLARIALSTGFRESDRNSQTLKAVLSVAKTFSREFQLQPSGGPSFSRGDN